MHFFRDWGILLMASLIAASCTAAEKEKISGIYTAQGGQSMILTLQEAASGAVTGTLTESGTSVPGV